MIETCKVDCAYKTTKIANLHYVPEPLCQISPAVPASAKQQIQAEPQFILLTPDTTSTQMDYRSYRFLFLIELEGKPKLTHQGKQIFPLSCSLSSLRSRYIGEVIRFLRFIYRSRVRMTSISKHMCNNSTIAHAFNFHGCVHAGDLNFDVIWGPVDFRRG